MEMMTMTETELAELFTLRQAVRRVLLAAGFHEDGTQPRGSDFEAVEDEIAGCVWVAFYGAYDHDDPAAVEAWRVEEAGLYRRAVAALRAAGHEALVEQGQDGEGIAWCEVRQ